ncbi:MAG: diaminobutyrate acetyltransferase [Dehalococcoidia bacterium]
MARDSGGLDLNSPYAYLLLSHFFSDTCAVARSHDELVGFIAGFRPPIRPESLFVWQIAVAPTARERGVGRRMLAWLLHRLSDDGVTYLEATVTPSNEASHRMFKGLARQLDVPCSESCLFAANQFPDGAGHEDEVLLRIGPFDKSRVAQAMRVLEPKPAK